MSAADVIKLCDQILEASKADISPLPWFYNSYSAIHSIPRSKELNAFIDAIPDDAPDGAYAGAPNSDVASVEILAGDTATVEGACNANYICIAANCAPALAEYVKRLHEAAAARGIYIDTWDLPRQPR